MVTKGHMWREGTNQETESNIYTLCCAVLTCDRLFVTPMDCSPPGCSVHGILQVRILEWVAMPSSRGSSQPRDRTQVHHISGRFFTILATREAQEYWRWVAYPFSRESFQPRNQTWSPALQADFFTN